MESKKNIAPIKADLLGNEVEATQNVLRPLSQAEISAVAGGPETDVTTGIG